MSAPETYDVVIVGSGLGGLLSAVILAKEGKKVCILEKDKQIGGCLQTFSLHKTVFDSCVHYIGGLGEGHTLNQIFSYAGIMDKLKLKALDQNGFDKIAFGEERIQYPHAIGLENFEEQLLPYFPKERSALQKYIRTLTGIGDHFPLYRLRLGSANEKAAVSHLSLTDTLASITDNSLLQSVLAGNNLLYAGESGKSPFYLQALVLESYIHSAHKVLPGSSQISKYLWQVLGEYGGVIHRNADVTALVEKNGQVEYAEISTSERFYGKQFIANVHPAVLLKLLKTDKIRPAYRNRIEGLKQTASAFMLNLVLKPRTVQTRNYNVYWHADSNVWRAVNYKLSEWPLNYALYFSESADHPGYAESLSVLTYMHYDEVKKWEQTLNHSGSKEDRGEEYAEFKENRAHKLLETVYHRVPELKGNILASSTASPLTYRDYTATPSGSLYGILKDVNKPNETTVATRTKIPNLLLTGQNVNLHGVLGVSITAIATSAELVGIEYLLNKIQGSSSYQPSK